MLRYLLGIVTALIFVAAFVIWSSMPGNRGTGGSTANGGSAATKPPEVDNRGDNRGDKGKSGGSTLFPRGDRNAATRGLKLGGDTDTAAMRREIIPRLGFSIDIPEAWMKLDAAGMRRYFSEFQGMTDQRQVDSLVTTIVLAAISAWPKDTAVANVFINHRLAPSRDVVSILKTMVEQKRNALQALEVISPPARGQLGSFWGGSVRTRETSGTGDQAEVRDAVVWILRVADGYMLITADAAAGDAQSLALIERMLNSVAVVRKPG